MGTVHPHAGVADGFPGLVGPEQQRRLQNQEGERKHRIQKQRPERVPCRPSLKGQRRAAGTIRRLIKNGRASRYKTVLNRFHKFSYEKRISDRPFKKKPGCALKYAAEMMKTCLTRIRLPPFSAALLSVFGGSPYSFAEFFCKIEKTHRQGGRLWN